MNAIFYALLATGFTFLMTMAGSACVFLFTGDIKPGIRRAVLGFAAGVMVAASCWSMLIPAIEMAQEQEKSGFLQACGGFLLGGVSLLFLDNRLAKLYNKKQKAGTLKNDSSRGTALLFGTITLHNIPEGMAVGLAFAVAASQNSAGLLASAAVLALGIGMQNFPEGAAVSLPYRQEGHTRGRSFLYGALSGAVEPVGGVIAVLLAASVAPLLPWLLSFSAGAMIYAVSAELIPQANSGRNCYTGIVGVIVGFAFMMTLDVALG